MPWAIMYLFTPILPAACLGGVDLSAHFYNAWWECFQTQNYNVAIKTYFTLLYMRGSGRLQESRDSAGLRATALASPSPHAITSRPLRWQGRRGEKAVELLLVVSKSLKHDGQDQVYGQGMH